MSLSGLLVLTSPLQSLLQRVSKVLTLASQHVDDVLYVHLAPDLSFPAAKIQQGGLQLPKVPCHSLAKQVVSQLYTQAANHHQHLDLRIILTNVGVAQCGDCLPPFKLQFPYEVLLTDGKVSEPHMQKSLLDYATAMFSAQPNVSVFNLDLATDEIASLDDVQAEELEPLKTYNGVCLGGTFDRIHTGHKILLSEALMLCDKRYVVGVADGKLTAKKTLHELMHPCPKRIQLVKDFLMDVKPQLDYHVVPITDPYGPSITEPDLQCIVVSEETLKGGSAVNAKRAEKGFSELDIDIINIVEDPHHTQGEEEKISSSSRRMRLLGTVINDIQPKPLLPPRPYVIGLTGGIASGKSSVCKRLQGLGAAVIDCDKLGHKSYEPGAPAYSKIIEAFGEDIVNPDKSINRRMLGGKVFGNKNGLSLLNSIVWPVIADLAREEMREHHREGVDVVLLDAAVLLDAGWDEMVHEVWTTVIPEAEAVKRIGDRNGLSEEESLKRIRSQMSNQERVDRANVVICTLWEYDVTQKQVEKAWDLLMSRFPAV